MRPGWYRRNRLNNASPKFFSLAFVRAGHKGTHYDLGSHYCRATNASLPTLAGCVELMCQVQQIGDFRIKVIRPKNIDLVIDWYIARGDLGGDPYWADLWASAVAASQFIEKNAGLVEGKSVGEIGCGLGLATLTSILAGAKEVMIMDKEPMALQCALLSARANGISCCSAAKFSNIDGEKKAIEEFESACTLNWDLGQVQCQPFDWHETYVYRKFQTVIAADVLYEQVSAEPLAQALPSMLEPAGCVLLVDPQSRAPAHRQLFLNKLGDIDGDIFVEVTKRMTPNAHDGDMLLTVLRKRVGFDTVGRALSSLQ